MKQAMEVLRKYIVLTGNVGRIEHSGNPMSRGRSFEKQVKDLMDALRQASDSLQRIMTSRGLKDIHVNIDRFYEGRFGRYRIPNWRHVGNQNAYMLFNNLERFVAGARAYCRALL